MIRRRAAAPFRLMAVIDRAALGDDHAWLECVAKLARVPGLWLQLRIKMLPRLQRITLLAAAAQRLGAARRRTLVNGTAAEARAWRLAGAHFPEASAPELATGAAGLLRGVSVHSLRSLHAARRVGADYVIAGAVFAPTSKPGAGRGLAWLRRVTRAAQLPVIAIGGVTPARVADCLNQGAAGVAVLGGIVLARDPARAVLRYRARLR